MAGYEHEPVPQRAGHCIAGRLPALQTTRGGASVTLPVQAPPEGDWTRTSNGKLYCRPGHFKVGVTDLRLGRRKGRKPGQKGSYFLSDLPPPGRASPEDCAAAAEGIPQTTGAERTGTELIPKTAGVFDMAVWGPQGCDTRQKAQLESWMRQYNDEQVAFSSVATWAEVVLRRVASDTAHLARPNPLRTAVCCMLLDRVTALFGRYDVLLRKLKNEIFASIYNDWPDNSELPDKDDTLVQLLPLPGQPQRRGAGADGAAPAAAHAGGEPAEPQSPRGRSPTSRGLEDEEDDDDASVGHQRKPPSAASTARRQRQSKARSRRHLASAEPPPHEPATVTNLNNKSTYFQVIRQLLWSKDSALTVCRDRSELPITDVLNAAISRWQVSLVRLYFLGWRKVGEDQRSKKRRVRVFAEKLFARKNRDCKKTTFYGWRDAVRQKKMELEEQKEGERNTVLNVKMAQRAKHYEDQCRRLRSERDVYAIEFQRCTQSMREMTRLLENFRALNAETRSEREREEEEAAAAAEREVAAAAASAEVAKEHTPEEAAAAAPATDAGAPSEEGRRASAQSAPSAAGGAEGSEVPAAEDAAAGVEDGEVEVERTAEEIEHDLKRVNEKAAEMVRRVERNQGSVRRTIAELGRVQDDDAHHAAARRRPEPEKKDTDAPQRPHFSAVLHWVNMHVHSLRGPCRRVTNFVTDFRNCHNYAYLLHTLGAAVSHPHLVKDCTDPKGDEVKKAEMVISAAEVLLGESLASVIKPTDILKAKAQKNANMIFMLYGKFATKDPITEADFAARDQQESAGRSRPPSQGSSRDVHSAKSSGAGRASDSGSEEAIACVVPTEEDYARWYAESSGDDEPGQAEQRSGLVMAGAAPGEVPELRAGTGTERALQHNLSAITSGLAGTVTFGDILAGRGIASQGRDASTVNGSFAAQLHGGGSAAQLPTASKLQRYLNRVRREDSHHFLLVWLNGELPGAPPAESFAQDLRSFERYAMLLHALRPAAFPLGAELAAAPFATLRSAVIQGLRALGVSVHPPDPPRAPDGGTLSPAAEMASLERERQQHMVFLAALYAALVPEQQGDSDAEEEPSPRPAAVGDIFDISLSRAAALHALGGLPPREREEAADDCAAVLRQHAQQLRRVLLHYAATRGGVDGSSPAGVLTRAAWGELCADCGIDAVTTRWPPGGPQPLSTAAACLLRAAAAQRARGPAGQQLRRLLERQILRRADCGEHAAFTSAVDSSAVQAVLQRHSKEIDAIFAAHAAEDPTLGRKVLSGSAFLNLLAEARLYDASFTAAAAGGAMAHAQSDDGGLSRHEFGHALAAVGAIRCPTPWLSLAQRLHSFLSSQLLPRYAASAAARGRTPPPGH
eukprot:TRINITY_DN1098_c0_g2_i1.p1 TRINITY_DN1098_c0_g2~~TRINITY_DN1098_c0_g2_i1.p1  ORF type:complete len:1385 (+),score=482.40 TRINITY_DN1098_c0_g2_i1:73-4155(+)